MRMATATQPALPPADDGPHLMTVDHIGGRYVLACTCGAFGDDGRMVQFARPAVQQAIDHATAMHARRIVIAATR